ncbi:MAG TPA: hypothetical protein VGJ78_03715, partial [Vicinamibacterales bacterium]
VGTGLYRVQFELPAGTYLMRAVVREPGGLVGSADRRFQVRALNGPDVTTSDLVLGSADVAGLPVRAMAYGSDVLDGVFELYGRTAAQLDALTVTADLVPVGGGQAAVSARADLQPVKSVAGGMSRSARVDLPLAGVRPGEYLVHATIRDKADTIAELLRDVTVRPGTRPPTAVARGVAARFDPLDVLRGTVAQRLAEAIETRAANAALEPGVRAADASILRGMAAFAKGDYTAAIAAFGAAQNAGNHDAALLFVLGWAHAAGGDDPAAITAWRNAIVGDPTLVPSYLALIDSYVRLGHPELALQVVKSGLRELPNSPELLDRRARIEGR